MRKTNKRMMSQNNVRVEFGDRPLLVETAYEDAQTYEHARFDDPRGAIFGDLETRQLSAALALIPLTAKVLEIGCGTGRFLRICSRAGHEVYGVDPSAHMIKEAAKNLKGGGRVRLAQAEGAHLPFEDESFDLVFTIRTVNQVSSKQYAIRMLREALRVTRPGGVALIEFMNRWGVSPKGTMLSIFDILRIVREHHSTKLIRFRGILFFSFTAMRLVPRPLLTLFVRCDRALAYVFPWLCTRCYAYIAKEARACRS